MYKDEVSRFFNELPDLPSKADSAAEEPKAEAVEPAPAAETHPAQAPQPQTLTWQVLKERLAGRYFGEPLSRPDFRTLLAEAAVAVPALVVLAYCGFQWLLVVLDALVIGPATHLLAVLLVPVLLGGLAVMAWAADDLGEERSPKPPGRRSWRDRLAGLVSRTTKPRRAVRDAHPSRPLLAIAFDLTARFVGATVFLTACLLPVTAAIVLYRLSALFFQR